MEKLSNFPKGVERVSGKSQDSNTESLALEATFITGTLCSLPEEPSSQNLAHGVDHVGHT